MQVFKAFMKVLRKRLFPALMYVSVFVFIGITMAKFGDSDSKFTATELSIGIIDEDDTAASRAFADFIGENNKILDLGDDMDVITDQLYHEYADSVIVIRKGYSEKLAAGETDGIFDIYRVHESYAHVYCEQMLDEYAAAVKAYTTAGMSLDEAVKGAGEALTAESNVTIETFDDNNSGFSKSFASYFQFLPYILISAIMSTLCPVLLVMNKKEIRYRTNCSSVDPSTYTLQIFAGSLVFVMSVWLILMGVGIFLDGSFFHGRAWAAVLNSLIFAFIATAISVFVSTFCPGDNLLNLIIQAVGLGMSLFCGIFVPQSVLSSSVVSASRFLPAYWYIRANEMLCGKVAYDFGSVAICLAIEAGFAVAITAITVLIRKIRYSSSSILTAVKA